MNPNRTTTRVLDRPAGGSLERGEFQGSRMAYSRLIGALFLAGFLSYGVGFGLVSSVVGTPDFLSTIPAHQTTLILGALLMLSNSVVDVGKGVLFFPIVENHGKRTALAYLAAMIFEVVLMAVGVLFLLMLVPLAEQVMDAGGAGMDSARTLGSLAVEANTMAYQISQMSLGIGATFLCLLLFRTRMIPRFLSAWGVVGYVMHAAGAIAEIFGFHISLVLLIPGGLFELALALWLIVRGFDSSAIVAEPANVRPQRARDYA
jgi:hypothetical protein